MSLLFMDGFDHYTTANLSKKGWAAGSSVNIATTAGRRGSGCLRGGGSTGYAASRTFLPCSTLVVGFAFAYTAGGGNVSDMLLQLIDLGYGQVNIYLNSDGTLSVRRGTTVLATSARSLIRDGAHFNYVEFKATIHNTAGAYELRVNGETWASASNVNTRSTANNSVNGVFFSFSGGLTNNAGIYDDLYICDSAGTTNNDFLGDVRIDTIYPTSDGTYSQFAPSTGTDHYSLVDETTPNATDYVDGLTVGQIDSYGMGDLSPIASQIVYGVQVNTAALKDDAGAKGVATMVRSGSTDAEGASAALGTSQMYVSQIYETNPNGSVAWTEATVNAMEAGVKVTA